MKDLKGKTVWITGASSGIGEELAYAFAKENANLILTARNIDKLNVVKHQCLNWTKNCDIVPIDLSTTDGLEEIVSDVAKNHKNIDVLVNNAGRSQRSYAIETPLENDRNIMELNFFSAVALTKLVLPIMSKNKSGHIVAISSIAGKFGFPLRTAYSASKHAIQGFYESLRPEVYKDNIEVTIVSPGRVRTNISKNALKKDGTAHGEMDPGQENGMPADVCAQKIISAIKKNKNELLVGNKEILMVYIRKFLPFLFHRIVKKISNK